jgi:PhnB protein
MVLHPGAPLPCSIAPWLSVRNGVRAVDFYKSAFGATEVFRLDAGGGLVARLSVDDAEFWLGDESPDTATSAPSRWGAVRFEWS